MPNFDDEHEHVYDLTETKDLGIKVKASHVHYYRRRI